MVSNRFQAHEQLPGYLLVALALRNQGEDFLFALGEFREGALRAAALGAEKKPMMRSATPGPKTASPLATARMACTTPSPPESFRR